MDAKRGYVPEDDNNFSPDSLILLRRASAHVIYLINEGYDLKQSVTFAGNHFQLSERQRMAIMRSVSTEEQIKKRKGKQIPVSGLSGTTVWIDGFNTIITLEVMLNRTILLKSMDGTIRDLASLRGTYRLIAETEAAVRLMFDVLAEAGIKEAKILLDQPVSNSGRLKTLIAEAGESYPFGLDIQILRDVDRELYLKENVITSDSVILDRCRSWADLAEKCVKRCGAQVLQVW